MKKYNILALLLVILFSNNFLYSQAKALKKVIKKGKVVGEYIFETESYLDALPIDKTKQWLDKKGYKIIRMRTGETFKYGVYTTGITYVSFIEKGSVGRDAYVKAKTKKVRDEAERRRARNSIDKKQLAIGIIGVVEVVAIGAGLAYLHGKYVNEDTGEPVDNVITVTAGEYCAGAENNLAREPQEKGVVKLGFAADISADKYLVDFDDKTWGYIWFGHKDQKWMGDDMLPGFHRFKTKVEAIRWLCTYKHSTSDLIKVEDKEGSIHKN